MSSEWKTFVLRDVASIIGGGTPSTKEATYWDGNIPWLTPKDLSSHTGMYVKRGERSITKAGLDGSSAKIVPPGTVLFTSRAPIGYLAIAEQAISTNQGFKSLVLNTEQDNRFFYYLLRFHTPDIEAIATGSTFKEISGSALGSFEVTIPSYGEQTKIADILTTLDDRIELLRETNATLEAIAQALFKSWFVDFDPVRAKQEGREPEGMDADTAALFPDSFEESELGLIPKVWTVKCLRDITNRITKGTTPTTLKRPFVASGINFIKVESLTEDGEFIPGKFAYIDNETHELLKRSQLQVDDVLITIAGTIGRIAVMTEDFLPANTNQAVALIRPDPDRFPGGLIKHFLQRDDSRQNMVERVVQAVQANLSLGSISDLKVVVPPSKVVKQLYDAGISQIDACKNRNQKHIRTLTNIRDTLLPRLISGQLRIPEAEALIEEASA